MSIKNVHRRKVYLGIANSNSFFIEYMNHKFSSKNNINKWYSVLYSSLKTTTFSCLYYTRSDNKGGFHFAIYILKFCCVIAEQQKVEERKLKKKHLDIKYFCYWESLWVAWIRLSVALIGSWWEWLRLSEAKIGSCWEWQNYNFGAAAQKSSNLIFKASWKRLNFGLWE